MLIIEKPTSAEMAHCWELAEGGIALVERKQPIAEVAPVEGRDGQYWAKHEVHGDPYAVVYFLPASGV